MASVNTTTDKEVLKGPKPEDLDIIANVMDNILTNMKSHVQNRKKNKKSDMSSITSGSPNLTSETQQEIMADTQKPVKIPKASNKNMKPPPISKNDETKPKDRKNNSTKKQAHSAVQNTQKKTVSNKKDESIKSNICNNVQNNKQKENNTEKFSSSKMKVANRKNNTFVTKSLSTMMKQNNAPKIFTAQIVNNKPIADNRRNTKSSSPSITDNMNIITRNTKTKSISAKTGNITNPMQQTKVNSLQAKSNGKSISCKTSKIHRPNKIVTLREKNFNSVIDLKSNKKQLQRQSLYVTPKEFIEKQIHKHNMLRAITQCETRPCPRIIADQKRPLSVNMKSCPNRKLATGTQNRNIQKQNVNNKRPAQEKSKSQYEVRTSQNTNNDIRSTFQNVKKLNDDKENQIPGPSTSQPNKSVSLDPNSVIKTIPLNQLSSTSSSSNKKQTASLKCIKSNEKPKIQKENDTEPASTETEIKEPKRENEIKNDTLPKDALKLNDMGDGTVKLINEKIQDIIAKNKEEKDNVPLKSCKTSSTNAGKISQTQKKEQKSEIKKPSTAIAKPISNTNNNKVNNKRNIKIEQLPNTKKPSTNNQQKNSPNVKSSVTIPKGVSKPSIQSCVVPKSNNMLCVPPTRKLSILSPMEIVQDFINLVNRAKRDRKTFTVCGNYYSVRKAFVERGWIEKLRINLIDDRESWRKLDTLSNFELVEGTKDKQHGEVYRRVFISKLLAGHQVDFYWDYMTNPFNVNNDKIKRTIINRFPFGSTRAYTSKAGLCESLKDAHWYFMEGHSNILFPRTYNLAYEEEISSFIEDFRLTAVISLLKWITKCSTNSSSIMSPSGQIQTSVFNFATMQCYNYIKIKEHKDLDDIIPSTKEYEWDIFLEKFYKIIHQGAHFKQNESITAPLLVDQARYLLNKMQKYLPRREKDGYMNLWLLKPNNGSRGCGIHVCRTLKYTLDMISTRKETKYVIQKYIERPLLIHNTKFDIRQWFLVTCMPNLHVWLYKYGIAYYTPRERIAYFLSNMDCYLRFSSQMYDLSKLHESIHLTNNSIQCRYKNNANRNAALPDQNMWHSDTFRKYLTEIGQPYAWKNIIYKGIKECLVGLFMLCQDRLLTRVNSFELCGADFMLTEDFRPYLIEINSRPALYPSTKITGMMCPKVLEDVVRVTVDYARNPRAGTGNFELIYKDTYSYVPPKNISSLFIDGISYVKYATNGTKKKVQSPFEKLRIKSLEDNTGSIQKILQIDPTKVRKDVKNTLEKILAIIHSEQTKSDGNKSSDDKNKQFRMMLLDFVDIISCAKNKPESSSRSI